MKRRIPTTIVFGLLMGLVQCSDSAMRSAIYEPDYVYNQEETQVPVGPTTKSVPIGTSSTAERGPGFGNRRQGDDEKAQGSQAPGSAFTGRFGGGSSTGDTTTTRPGRGHRRGEEAELDEEAPTEMKLTVSNKADFMKALWPEASPKQKLDLESVRIELKTLEVHETLGERHLSGYFVIYAKGLKPRYLSNNGAVIFSNGGNVDVMSAEFRLGGGASFVVDMTRTASRTVEEADTNAWSGTLTLVKKDKRTEIAEMTGIVNLWNGEDK
jgi:hypothetical protein